MGLAGKLSGSRRRGLAGRVAGVAPDVAAFLAGWKAELNALDAGCARNLWLVDPTTVTLNGANLSGLADSWGSAPMSQGTAANQPPLVVNGGPNNRPYAHLADATDGLTTGNVLAIAADHRVGWYAVMASNALATEQWMVRITDAAAAVNAGYDSLHRRHSRHVGGNVVATVTSPAQDLRWHLHALRPLATGALYQIDGVTTSPAVGRSDGLAAFDIANIGRPGTFSGGRVAMLALVVNPTDAKNEVMTRNVATLFGATPQ